jgi:phosphatidylglycerophosphate synthase
MTSPTSRTPERASPGEPRPVARGGSLPRPSAVKPPEIEELVDQYLHRPIARRLVDLLVHTPITPNQITLIAAFLGVAAGLTVGYGAGRPRVVLAGGVLLFLSVVLDCCDGQLARRKGISSTYGAILDGIGDYAVGLAMGLGGSMYMVALTGNHWYWLLGLAGIASSAAQSALFDHAKTRYIARVGGGYAEREEDLDQVERDRALAWSAHRYRDALLLWVYLSYSRAQHAAMTIQPADDPVAYRAAHAGRMRAWTFLGIGTHFAFAYLTAITAFWWPPAPILYFAGTATVFNVVLATLVALEPRQGTV